jgi:hypothetical protein
MPTAIFGPYDFLNFNGKLFSRKHEHLVFVKFPAPPSAQTVMGASYNLYEAPIRGAARRPVRAVCMAMGVLASSELFTILLYYLKCL